MKRKEKEIQNVVGGEGDENGDVKTKQKWFEKQRLTKKMKLVVKKMKTKTNKEAVKTTMKRYFENSF